MPSIRRSGGAVAFFWQGKLLDPRDDAFAAVLQQQRFRTIEDAASEEVSIGWVTAVDPTGESFTNEDLDAGLATWLRLRIDKKQLPRKWLQVHRDVAEKAKGKKLSAKERRELKDDLMDKLLPRVLPTINMVDALLYHDRRTVILLNTSKSVGEAFDKLFFQTFQVTLEKSDPLQLGFQAGLDPETQHKLQRAEPVRWPKSEPSDEPRRRRTVEQEEYA
ncbi:MAG: recombination-associated protein RdgC [Planctomycetota bacterium]